MHCIENRTKSPIKLPQKDNKDFRWCKKITDYSEYLTIREYLTIPDYIREYLTIPDYIREYLTVLDNT